MFYVLRCRLSPSLFAARFKLCIARMLVSVCACVRAVVFVCVCVCLRACVRACVCVRARAYALKIVSTDTLLRFCKYLNDY